MLYSADSSIVCLVSRTRVRLLHLVQLLLFVEPQNCSLYFIIYLKHILYVCSNLHFQFRTLWRLDPKIYFCTGPRNVLKWFCLCTIDCFVKRRRSTMVKTKLLLFVEMNFSNYVHLLLTFTFTGHSLFLRLLVPPSQLSGPACSEFLL